MKQDKCAICGTTENLEHHHLVPKGDGGTDDETNILTLCSEHHATVHGVKLTKQRKSWGNPNTILKGQYCNLHVKRGSKGKFVKKDKVKRKAMIYLSEEEWKYIDKSKGKYKCGRGGFISIMIKEYMNKNSENPLKKL